MLAAGKEAGLNEPAELEEALRLDRQLCFAVYAAGHAYGRLYKPLLDPLGLTYPQYLVMLVLWEQDGITLKAIGQQLMLDSGTLTPLLKRLEAAGLVSRRRSTADERQVIVRLTPQGAALKAAAARIPPEIARAFGKPEAEVRALRQALAELRRRLGNRPAA